MSTNETVARLFEEYADILEAKGDDYRPRSYRRAADSIREYPDSVDTLVAEGEDAVQSIDGVGESLAEKIIEYVETGEIETIEEAKSAFPINIAAITAVEGIGPKRAGDFYRELGVTSLDELDAAAREARIQELDGYGAKTEENILDGIEFARQAQKRRLLGEARPVGENIRDFLRESDGVERAELGGSLRRWKETIGDVDVLATGEDPEAIIDRFVAWGDEKIESGPAKASVWVAAPGGGRLDHDNDATRLRVDLRVVDPQEWGAALQYFTGSKEHNIRIRNRAIERDFKINEYGVFDVSEVDASDEEPRAGKRVAGVTEEEVYATLDMAWMPPELREDRSEVDAAVSGDLPDLVNTEEIRGDLHTHSEWSDGGHSIETMLAAAADRDYDYIGITDHASGPGVVAGMGLDDAEIRDQIDAIADAAADIDVEAFSGIEANIDTDGEISVQDDVLADLDLVIASPHSGLDGNGTDRLISAIEHPEVDVIGHPSGRILNGRPGLELDVERVAEAAVSHDTALEVNANPHRLDLWDHAIHIAVEAGAPIAINTDAHSPSEYDLIEYGVRTARRGWAETTDVLNTRDTGALRAFLG